jgi:NADP-dependent 3-hydroxy acid dehydrogenase YdfG
VGFAAEERENCGKGSSSSSSTHAGGIAFVGGNQNIAIPLYARPLKTLDKSFLSGRKAIVSGGSSGIGLAIAKKLQQAGAQTAVADIAPMPALPESPLFFSCDITQASQVRDLYKQVTQDIGHPDILVSNAGQGIHEKLAEGDPEKWQGILNLNVMGALRLVRAFVPGMLEKGFGDVVFISSVAAGQAYPYGGIYAATKSALQTIAETLRQEVMPTVRITTLAPGVTDTAFFDHTVSGFHTPQDLGYGALPPDTIADMVVYALSQPQEISVNHITIRPTRQPF